MNQAVLAYNQFMDKNILLIQVMSIFPGCGILTSPSRNILAARCLGGLERQAKHATTCLIEFLAGGNDYNQANRTTTMTESL